MGMPLNIYEQQKKNQRATWLVIIVFILFFAFLGFGFDVFFLGFNPPEDIFPFATLFATALSSFSAYLSYIEGPNAVIAATHAKPVDISNFKEKQFDNIVEEMAISAGLPRPRAYILPDSDPNAFAAGTNSSNSVIAVTTGILEKLSRDELQGVVAHEMSHIRNYDTRMMTVIAALVGGVALLSDWAGRSIRYGGLRGGRGRKVAGRGNAALLILWLVAIILAPIVAQILAMMVSRKREFLADASGAELTRNPMALAEALKKIEFAAEPTKSISKGTAHLCIVDPLGRRLNNKESFAAEILSTHPPAVKRMSALREMAFQYQPPS